MLAVAACATGLFAATHDVSAWKGETVSVTFVRTEPKGATPFVPALKGLPQGVSGKIGLIRPVKFEREPNSGEFISGFDRVEWNGSEASLAAGKSRNVVIELTVAPDAKPGTYLFRAAGEEFALTILDRVLPPAKDWKYYLDLWQHPWAVSRWENVKPFSKPHYDAMRPLWELLAGCGQKMLTTTITKLPWNHQCFDGYDTMIRHIRKADGTWTFDYSVFDEYVAFGKSCGIGPYIGCYTMVPWGYVVYGETEKGEEIKIKANPGTPEFEDYWKPFLIDFVKHLKAKGWFDDVFVSMDERAPEDMRKISAFIGKYGSGLKIATAGNFDPSTMPDLKLQNYSPVIDTVTPEFLAKNLEQRRKQGFLTNYYVCCVPYKPNSFLESPWEESFWCGFFPAAKGLDGFLRWAYNSWPYDPRHDGSYGNWRAGDTYFVYQDASPSVRLLELRSGIIAAEKFRILKEEGKCDASLKALAAKYDYFSARKEGVDLKPLKAETLAVVNALPPEKKVVRDWITLKDGTRLAAIYHVPAKPSKDGRYPVSLSLSPYMATRMLSEWEIDDAEKRGHVRLNVDVRGRCNSEGVFEPYDVDFPDDARAVLDWAGSQPWSDGHVFMTGGSYPAATQLAAMRGGSPTLTACSPSMMTINSYYLYYQGGVPAGIFKNGWHRGFGGEASYERLLAHDEYDEWWQAKSDVRDLDKNHAAVFFQAGWYDQMGFDTFGTLAALRKNGRKVFLRLGPWAHGVNTYGSGIDYSKRGGSVTEDLEIAFLDAAVRGAKKLPTDDLPGQNLIYVLGADEWRYFDSWPVKGLTPKSFTLGEETVAIAHDGEKPVPTMGGRFVGKNNMRCVQTEIEKRVDVKTFDLPAANGDLTFIGEVTAEITFKSTAAVQDIAVKLCEVDEKGESVNIVDGIQRVKNLKPGEWRTVSFKVDTTAFVVKAGRSLRVQLAASNAPHFVPLAGRSTLTIDLAKSAITLPIIEK